MKVTNLANYGENLCEVQNARIGTSIFHRIQNKYGISVHLRADLIQGLSFNFELLCVLNMQLNQIKNNLVQRRILGTFGPRIPISRQNSSFKLLKPLIWGQNLHYPNPNGKEHSLTAITTTSQALKDIYTLRNLQFSEK